MRTLVLATLLPLLAAPTAPAQQLDRQHSIEVTFTIDKQPIPCEDLKVTLRIGNRLITPETYKHSFLIPPIIEKLYASKQTRAYHNITATITCSHHTLAFPNLYPVAVMSFGAIGIAHPPYWFEEFAWRPDIDHATWMSYLEYGELIVSAIHTTPQPAYVAHLLQQQPSASGEQARDIAYALAVYHVDYEKNREYLLSLFTHCLNMTEQPETDECSDLLSRITNIAWHGDPDALHALLVAVDFRTEVTHGDGRDLADFYTDLLSRSITRAVQALTPLPIGKQEAVCERAAEHSDTYNHKQQLTNAQEQLTTLNNPTAKECLRQIGNELMQQQ